MAAEPLVSVIIPCYNYGRYLGDALDSIAAQTYSHWECLVVDDGSTDNTSDVGMQYAEKDSRFSYIYQQNGGVSSARNTALNKAKGKYIQLLDADDMLEPDKLQLQVSLLEENQEH
jgi:glycosyltransferase involved in cell wall biosynthesis